MKNKLAIGAFFLLLTLLGRAEPPTDKGKTIFLSRCASCHNVNKQLTGPALAGVDARHPIDWIVRFVRSSQSVVNSGDKYALALFEKFNRIKMPDHQDLTDDNIKDIVDYVKAETKVVGNDSAPFATPVKKSTMYLPLSIKKDYEIFIGYFVLVMLLIGSLLLAVHVRTSINEQQPADQ